MDPMDVARSLYAQDRSADAFGIELIDAGPDGATVRMTVRPDMCNGFEIIHGGMTFLLADSAMAFASNSENDMALATSANLDWFAPARPGDVLTAVATRAGGGRKSVVWDVRVTNQDDEHIAQFRGRTRRIGQPIIT